MVCMYDFFFFQAEDGIRDYKVTGVQTCALPISLERREPLERDGSPVREADAERGSGARAGGTRGREAPSARRTRLRLSLFARPAVRVAHDVGTRSPSPGDCSVQRRSNPARLTTGILEQVHLAVQNDTALLHPPIVATAENLPGRCRARRGPS